MVGFPALTPAVVGTRGQIALALGCSGWGCARGSTWGRAAVPLSRLVFQDAFPEGACAFLLQNQIHGRMYNDLAVGGYYIWRLHDAIPVFIDSRDNIVYDLGLLVKALDMETQPDGLKQLEALGIDVVAEFDELTRPGRFSTMR